MCSFVLEIIQYQNNSRMPLYYRPNHSKPSTIDMERVKQQESVSQDSESLFAEDNLQSNEGRWNQEENIKFVIFVNYYQDIFASRHRRKVCKIFRTFSEYLEGRSPAQCRSHYQKMIIKFKTIAKLKKHYKGTIGEDEYELQLLKFKQLWELTHPPVVKSVPQIKGIKQFGVQTDDLPIVQSVCPNCVNPLSVEQKVQTPTLSMTSIHPYTYWNDMAQFGGLNFFVWMPRSDETLQNQ